MPRRLQSARQHRIEIRIKIVLAMCRITTSIYDLSVFLEIRKLSDSSLKALRTYIQYTLFAKKPMVVEAQRFRVNKHHKRIGGTGSYRGRIAFWLLEPSLLGEVRSKVGTCSYKCTACVSHGQ